MATGSSGNVYIANSGNDRIQKVSPSGRVLAVWGKQGFAPGQFLGPQGLFVSSVGEIYVADTLNSRIQKLSALGARIVIKISGGPRR